MIVNSTSQLLHYLYSNAKRQLVRKHFFLSKFLCSLHTQRNIVYTRETVISYGKYIFTLTNAYLELLTTTSLM